jgi:hypothetical protein
MHADEIRPHDAVAVEEDAVDAARRQDRAVADFRREKPTIFVPDTIDVLGSAVAGPDPSSATTTSKL